MKPQRSLEGALLASKILTFAILASISCALVSAQTYSESILHTFVGGSTDGDTPQGGLASDSTGNLYGTTVWGGNTNCNRINGTRGCGVVFKLTPSGGETILHKFSGGNDGAYPFGPVVLDKSGDLYGVTESTVFKVTKAGKYSVLHVFGKNASDAAVPTGGLIIDSAGNLYGTSSAGGGTNSDGTIFKISAAGKESVVFTFPGGSGGSSPNANVLRDSLGNFYGTTYYGGTNSEGVLFKVSAKGQETILYSFCEEIDCADGINPGYIARDAKGNFWGTTGAGYNEVNAGLLFSISPKGVESQLGFCNNYQQSSCGRQGSYPSGSLLIKNGVLYGTTLYGGSGGVNGGGNCTDGTVYQIDQTGLETVLYSFCGIFPYNEGTGDPRDGGVPTAGVIMDSEGNLYGATSQGAAVGNSNVGTVFKLTKQTSASRRLQVPRSQSLFCPGAKARRFGEVANFHNRSEHTT